MSFREESAWISFVSIALVFFTYFAKVVVVRAGRRSGDSFHVFLVLLVALVVLEVVLHVAIARQSPRAARTPKDERERLIDMKATRLAFPVLLVGAFAAMGTMHLDAGRWVMAHVLLVGVVLAELTRFGAQIVYHRRGF